MPVALNNPLMAIAFDLAEFARTNAIAIRGLFSVATFRSQFGAKGPTDDQIVGAADIIDSATVANPLLGFVITRGGSPSLPISVVATTGLLRATMLAAIRGLGGP